MTEFLKKLFIITSECDKMLVRCEKCNRAWEVIPEDIKCPFCGYLLDGESDKIESLSDGIKWAIHKYGINILSESKKLLSILTDMVPSEHCDNLPLLKIAIGTSVVALILQMREASDAELKMLEQKAIAALKAEAYLAEEYATAVTRILMSGIGVEPCKDNNRDRQLRSQKKIITGPPLHSIVDNKSRDSGEFIGQSGSDSKGNYVYYGEVDDKGIPNGHGEITYDSGEVFTGIFVNGMLSGHGVWHTKDGNVFDGEFKNGKQIECDGILIENNGDRYEGHFRKGLRKHGTMKVIKAGQTQSIELSYDNGNLLLWY